MAEERLTFDQEEALIRGKIPLKEFKEVLKNQDESKIKVIDFSRNGYCNDAVLRLIKAEKKKPYENLESIILDGCILIGNAGIKWLSEIVNGATKLKAITLDGCTNLSDDELSLLLKNVGPDCNVLMRGTSVSYLINPEGRSVDTKGSPIITGLKTVETFLVGHALVVPHESADKSFAEFVKTKKSTKRLPFHHVTDVQVNDWMMTFSEMTFDHPLFDSLISSQQTQVVIPFGETAAVKEVTKHVIDVITRVITKTAFTTEYLKNQKFVEQKTAVNIEVDDFLTVQSVSKQHFKDGLLGNYSYKSEILGCMMSRTPFTRSNPYFEVEVVEFKKADGDVKNVNLNLFGDDSDSGDELEPKCGLLIGCLFNQLFSSQNPLDVEIDKGGEVSTFTFGKAKKVGFGIKGSWISEYIPSETCTFFAVCNGVEENKDLTNTIVPQEILYPLISVLGDINNSATVKLCNLAQPPEELTNKWEKENRWINLGYLKNMVIDNQGIMSMCSVNEDEAMFTSMESIDKEFSIKVIDKGSFGKIRIDLAKERDKDKGVAINEGWSYQCVTGEVLSEKKTNYIVEPSRVESGDILTVKFMTENEVETIVLSKNGLPIVKTPYTSDKDNGRSIVKLYIYLSESRSKVQLMNYRPRYNGPVPFPDKLTVGRLHNLKILDDGTLISKAARTKEERFSRCYIAKWPMNSQRLSFEVTVEDTLPTGENVNAVAVGFCHSEIPQKLGNVSRYSDAQTYFDISGGCAVLSSCGKLFYEDIKSAVNGVAFNKGDKVKCEVKNDNLLFDDDGVLSSQQKVLINFYINDTLSHQCSMMLRADGLFPAIFFDGTNDNEVKVKIHNFYPETDENRMKANLQLKAKKEKKEKEDKVEKKSMPCKDFRDCEFIVLELGKTSGKLQLVEEQLKADMFSSALEHINKAIGYNEQNLRHLDINRQSVYSALCQTKEKLENLVQKPNRIHYMVMDIESGKGSQEVLNQITDMFECRKLHQDAKYNLPKKCQSNIESIMEKIKKEGIIEFDAGLKDFEEGTLKLEGREFLQIARLLHEKGKVAIFQLCDKTVIAYIPLMMKVLEKIEKMSTMQLSDKLSTAINEASHVWTSETAVNHFVAKDDKLKGKVSLLMEILQDYMGVIELPAWRQKPDDTQFLYTTLDSLSSPPMSLREFWSTGTKDFITLQTTFSFIHSLSDHVLAAVLSSATKYGRTLLLTSEGAVFQIGCVQTVVVKHTGLMNNTVISIESKCYMPAKKCGPVDELTEVYVTEYTWNIFCLYTDLVEKILKQQNIIYIESREVPENLVNISVGCKHNWKHIPGKANQSICTMCNKCCGQGRKCQYNGIMGDNLRECLCKTSAPGCMDCGICVDCASELWHIRSYLRPQPMTSQDPEKKGVDQLDDAPLKTEDSNTQKKVTHEELITSYLNIPLDPVAFNEIECHILGGSMGFVLRDIDDGSRIIAFPGKAKTLDAETVGQKLTEKLSSAAVSDPLKYKNKFGDSVKLRITDPCKLITLQKDGDKQDLAEIQESRVVYHACISREMCISHETGLLCYNSASSSVPVAQFVGPKPFSEKLTKISVKIIDAGEKSCIGIGVCPGKTYPANRMPGWNRWSIAYHADDGGIFIEAGFANTHVVTCDKGDVMSLFCDVESKQLVFYKNDVEVKQIRINIPRGGYWPMIGLHSVGECVKLLEKEAWTPEPDDVPPKTAAFNTYKYGNLWISPAKHVSLTKKGYTNNYSGWMILHNPTKVVIGFKITPESLVKTPIGTIAPQDAFPFFLTKQAVVHREFDHVTVEWIAIEQVKEYTQEQILQLFAVASSTSIYRHRLGLLIKDSALGDVETLPQFEDAVPGTDGETARIPRQDGYKLEVFKNCMLVDSYLLKRGRYMLDVCNLGNAKAEYIIKRPKCPSFLYPETLRKGFRVVVKLDSYSGEDQFADAVISEIYDGGGYCVEYTPPGGGGTSVNEKICVAMDICGIEDRDWREVVKKPNYKEEMKIQLFTSPSAQSTLEKTYVPAPPYMTTKGSAEALEMIDPEWKKNALNSFCLCSQSITRPTVQEQIITKHSRKLLKWLSYRDASLPYAVIMLPSNLDASTLKYPVAKTMFSDVSIHRLCFFQDGYIDMTKMPMVFPSKLKKYPEVRSLYDDINIHSIAIRDSKEENVYPLQKPREVCLHLMDLPGFTVKGQVPVDISYGCLYQAWTYVALLTHKLLLPSYTKIFTGELGGLDREQIQNLLFQLIQPYASLCSIYSAQYGGLSNQENPTYLSEKIQDLCDNEKQPIPQEFLGKGMVSDNHIFVKFPPFLACKAHSHSRVDRNIVNIPNLSLEAKFYEPYSEKMDILMINGGKLQSLPPNLFQIFENLQVLTLMNVPLSKTPEFPSGISRCKDLEIVCLSGLPGLKTISKDILNAPALSTFYLHNIPITKLDLDWQASKTLTSLTLKGLLLTEVPKEIGQLSELQELNLDCNPIVTLPDELADLKKLKHLSAKGIPWIAFEGKYDQMPKSIYKTWHAENHYIVNYLSEKEVDALFDRHDANSNNILDQNEVAKLNFEFLSIIPRIGIHKLGDTVYGGVPEVVFKLKGLESLDLSYTAITCIPNLASELFTLQTLNLEHCPFLESVSGNVGLLPNLRGLYLNSCPLLETPPKDIVGRGFDSIKAFLKKMAGGSTECHRTKLMFIGLGQAGKTTLLQALKSPTKKTQGTQDAKLTDGIEIKPWIVQVNQDDKQYAITYSCWDFAGQTVYYNTHQFFLSKQAVYMLLWNMRMGFEHAGLDFWLSSVACHCPNAPVIIVGTQLDQIPMPDIPEKELMRKYPQIKKFCYVSSTTGQNIPELEATLIDVTLTYCSQMKLNIPKVWLNFEESILVERKRGLNILEWETLKQYAIDKGIYEEKDIRLAVQFLDDLGTVQYFDTEVLRDRVVINPQWIVDVMAKVVSVNEKSIKEHKGRFYHKFISVIWKDYDPSLHEWMLKLTERFDLTFPLPESEENVNVVPCLLPEEEPEDLPWPKIEEEAGVRESKIQYKFTYLPTGLFNRAQARLFSQGFTDNHLLEFLWKKGSILKKNNHYALVKQISDYEMIVTVQGPRPKNILDLIHETISTLIKDSFTGVEYDFYLPCPDCVEKEGTRDPFLFKAELISRAHSVNAPFLQCTKYFHTVSIGELMSIMPDNRDTEFDVQIQESIGTLQEISANLAKDVAILYSPEDIPPKDKEGELVDPREICKDLRMAGYNCWFPKDVNSTPELEMALAIKNSKVLVICMSERFVRHPKCHQMCLYAMDQLYKPFAIAVMDETLEWQATDIGFKIGNPRMAMIKNVQRYKKKIEDLIDIIKTHIYEIEKNVVSYPLVFISYCWANSHAACSNTTEAKEGSLGYGDPRALKKHLEEAGVQCWLDIEQMGKFGLYQDITVGLQNSKVLVICVSDEYLQSDACMMEARFGSYNLQMPMVVCVVGTGKAWKMSEVSLMIQKAGDMATVIKMQKEEKDLYDRAVEAVRSYLVRPETEKQRKVREKLAKVHQKQEKMKKEELEMKLKQQGDNKFSFQEEIELIQRKFMRHICKITRADDLESDLPKLLVFDFVKKASPQKRPDNSDAVSQMSSEERPETSHSLRPRTSKKAQSKDKMKSVTLDELEDDWQGEDFCIKVMCEDEQGWHLFGEPLSLISRTSEEIYKALKDAAPYLARIYAILKQSAINLNCLSSKKGENFLNYIRQEGIGTKNFTDAYKVIHKLVSENEDHQRFLSTLNRCYLQSGKIAWLCPKHQNKAGITQLQIGTASIHGTARVPIFEEDNLLSEIVLESSLYSDRIKGKTDQDSKIEKLNFGIPPSISREKSIQGKVDVKTTLEKKNMEVFNDNEEESAIPKKKSDKMVKIAETPMSMSPTPATASSRPSSTESSGAQSSSSTRSMTRNRSMRRQKSQACSLQ